MNAVYAVFVELRTLNRSFSYFHFIYSESAWFLFNFVLFGASYQVIFSFDGYTLIEFGQTRQGIV